MTTQPGNAGVSGAADHARQRLEQRTTTLAGIGGGLAVTLAFYLLAPMAAAWFPGGPQFVDRYFCSHPLEYITSALFFVGFGILFVKLTHLPGERRALRAVAQLTPMNADESSDAVTSRLADWTRSAPATVRRTSVAQRVEDVLHYRAARSGDGLEEHLRYLADLASDRLMQSYSLIRTITWAVPIMGFLGTVVGITMAIANVTPEQLDSSLPEVTAGLAVAFDTTAQALAMSMLLVFGTFLIERGELSVLNDVEQYGIDQWLPSLATGCATNAASPLPELAAWTSRMLEEQTSVWSRQMAAVQSGWSDALTSQTDALASALHEETQSTLAAHRNSLSGARDVYAATLQQSTHHFVSQLQQSLSAFSDRLDSWQQAMQTSTLAAAGQSEQLHALGRTLLQLTESEERLAQLQRLLNENLETLQVVETLEQTVNSLNAAVHVLTAKTSLRAAA
jgi:biopolymer transport protein ExbB/TolQ